MCIDHLDYVTCKLENPLSKHYIRQATGLCRSRHSLSSDGGLANTGDVLHFIIREVEIKEVEVLLHVVLVHGVRVHHYALLPLPLL